jgi:bifunctional non-homologous end joining protein LigD
VLKTEFLEKTTWKRGMRKKRKPEIQIRAQSSGSGRKRTNQSLAKELRFLAVPGARAAPMPAVVEPMKATLVDKPFSHEEWLFETKWDGVRALCFINGGTTRLVSRNQIEIGFRYPELASLSKSMDARQAILDGEIVCLNDKGISSFQSLQGRIGQEDRKEIARLAESHPVTFMVFDLLYHDGLDLTSAELIHRKAFLAELTETNGRLRCSEHVLRDGVGLYKRARQAGLEGIMAKHQASTYVQRRSNAWLKIKTLRRQEVVIAGYTKPRGNRPYFGSLVAGVYRDGRLQYVGHVGGGFDHEKLGRVYRLMQQLKISKSPFEIIPRTNEPVQWLKPLLVCELKFAEWTRDHRLRQPIFLALRDDKDPAQCVYEPQHDSGTEVVDVEKRISLRATDGAQ